MPQPMIYINSWPGVGKHTIAKELDKQMGGKVRVVSSFPFGMSICKSFGTVQDQDLSFILYVRSFTSRIHPVAAESFADRTSLP